MVWLQEQTGKNINGISFSCYTTTKMTTYYQIQLDYINSKGPAAFYTKFYPDGITLTEVPNYMRYKKKVEKPEITVVRPWRLPKTPGEIVVGDGSTQITFAEGTTYYSKSSDGESDSE